jgi:hypothetical protein
VPAVFPFVTASNNPSWIPCDSLWLTSFQVEAKEAQITEIVATSFEAPRVNKQTNKQRSTQVTVIA